MRLKSTACYQPMNFPLSPKEDSKMKAAFEMNLDVPQAEQQPEGKSPINDAKHFFKMLVSPKLARKTPSPAVSKHHAKHLQDTGVKSPKTLLGSPRLHRAFFGKERPKPFEQSPKHEYPALMNDSQSEASTRNSSIFNDSESFNESVVRSPASVSLSSQSSAACLNDSCPDTPKTPSIKPAMGISMIGKQRRTLVDSPFNSPPPSASRQTANYFTYSVPAKESSPVSHSIDGLEYPPVFEPGTYCLSTPVQASTPPIPAPRTKFLSVPVSSASNIQNSESNSSK